MRFAFAVKTVRELAHRRSGVRIFAKGEYPSAHSTYADNICLFFIIKQKIAQVRFGILAYDYHAVVHQFSIL